VRKIKLTLPSHGLKSKRYASTTTSKAHPFEKLQPNREIHSKTHT